MDCRRPRRRAGHAGRTRPRRRDERRDRDRRAPGRTCCAKRCRRHQRRAHQHPQDLGGIAKCHGTRGIADAIDGQGGECISRCEPDRCNTHFGKYIRGLAAQALVIDLADAGKDRADLAHQADIGTADRTGAAHDRDDVLFQQGLKCLDQFRRTSGVTGQRRVDANGDGLAHGRNGKRCAGAEMMRMHKAEIEGADLVFAPVGIFHRADAGIGAVDGFPAGNGCFHALAALADARHAGGAQADGHATRADGVEGGESERLGVKDDAGHGREFLQLLRGMGPIGATHHARDSTGPDAHGISQMPDILCMNATFQILGPIFG